MASVTFDMTKKLQAIEVEPSQTTYWYVDVRKDTSWRSLPEWKKSLICQWVESLGVNPSDTTRVDAFDALSEGYIRVTGYVRDFNGQFFLDENREPEMEMYYVFCDELPDLEVWRD